MIVVFDTNIWKSSLYLKANAAAAVRFYLHQKGAKVGLPEVVRLEVERHLRADIREIRDRIDSDHRRLLGMVGKLNEVILLDDAHIDEVVAGFISGLEFDLLETAFTLEAARSSFLRTIDKIAPSHNTQQFKDGVLWAACLTLACTDQVILVTNDKAFYEDGDIKKGLSKALKDETVELPYTLKIVGSLGALMEDIRAPVNVSDDLFLSAINFQIGANVAGLLDRTGFVRAGLPAVTTTFYATESNDTLYFEFLLEIPCEDVSSAGRVGARISVSGDGQYKAAKREFQNIRPSDLTLSYKNHDGTEDRWRDVYVRAEGAVMGTRTVYHRVKEPLEDSKGQAKPAKDGTHR